MKNTGIQSSSRSASAPGPSEFEGPHLAEQDQPSAPWHRDTEGICWIVPSPSLPTPFPFLPCPDTELIPLSACVSTPDKPRTQFPVISRSLQFHFQRAPCPGSLLAPKLHSFIPPQRSHIISLLHAPLLSHTLWFLSPSSLISLAVFSPRFQFLAPNWKSLS